MDVNVKDYDSITKCLECDLPIKKVKLNYIQNRIEGITEEELKILKLCSHCKRTLPRN